MKIQIFEEQNSFYFFFAFFGVAAGQQVTEFINRQGKSSKT